MNLVSPTFLKLTQRAPLSWAPGRSGLGKDFTEKHCSEGFVRQGAFLKLTSESRRRGSGREHAEFTLATAPVHLLTVPI